MEASYSQADDGSTSPDDMIHPRLKSIDGFGIAGQYPSK